MLSDILLGNTSRKRRHFNYINAIFALLNNNPVVHSSTLLISSILWFNIRIKGVVKSKQNNELVPLEELPNSIVVIEQNRIRRKRLPL